MARLGKRHKRWRWIAGGAVLILAACLIGLACGKEIDRVVTTRVQLARLASARSRWSRHAPSRYQLSLVTDTHEVCMQGEELCNICEQEIWVQEERVVDSEGVCQIFFKDGATQPPLTVTGLFDAIESRIRAPIFLDSTLGYVRVQVTYHDQLGYPVLVNNHWVPTNVATIMIFAPETAIVLTTAD
jgi:hypothetical protein